MGLIRFHNLDFKRSALPSALVGLLLCCSILEGQNSPVLHAFGDSITFGGKASNFATTAYIPLVAAAEQWPFINMAFPGDQAADAAVNVYGELVNPADVYSLEIGVNDEWIYGTDAARRAIYASAHLAELAWLSIPAGKKVTAHDSRVTYSGTWIDSSLFPGLGMQSSQSGASASFSVIGSTVLVGISQSDTAGGCEVGLSIDDTPYGTWNSASSTTIHTYKGTTFAPLLIRRSGLSPASHQVRLNVNSCNSPDASAFFEWAAGAGAGSGIQGASVYTLNVPRKSAGFYAAYPGGSNANVSDFNRVISGNVTALSADGLPISLVDIWSQLNTTTDLDDDGIHPNDRGHALISDTLIGVINASGSGSASSAPAAVRVLPGRATLSALQTKQFVAANSVQINDTFSWSLSRQFGSISSAGLYTAPNTIDDTMPEIEVIATSNSDPSVAGAALVAFNHTLTAGPLTPSSGSGVVSTFQFNVSNGQGVSTLNTASLLVNTSSTVVNAAGNCFVKYDRAGGRFYLGADSPSGAAIPSEAAFWVGSLAPGSPSSLSNSQCTLVGSGSSATPDASGAILQMAVSLQFKSAYTGAKTVFLSADDYLGHDTGWNGAGTWTINGTNLSAGTGRPSSGSGAPAVSAAPAFQ